MEKISHIVRGNSRIASTDLKSSSAVRPGAPSYGRAVGESGSGAIDEKGTTASRAASLHAQMNEARKNSSERVVGALADEFFMSRVRRPEEEVTVSVGGNPTGEATPVRASDEPAESAPADTQPPPGYTPRGSFINVQA